MNKQIDMKIFNYSIDRWGPFGGKSVNLTNSQLNFVRNNAPDSWDGSRIEAFKRDDNFKAENTIHLLIFFPPMHTAFLDTDEPIKQILYEES